MTQDRNPRFARRDGLAVPAVLTLIAIAAAVTMAATFQRRQAARDLVSVLNRVEAYDIAEAAVREVCQRGSLQRLFNVPEYKNKLVAAFAGGEYLNPPHQLKPAPLEMKLSPVATRMRYKDDPTVKISDVELYLTEYRRGLSDQGTLRGVAWIKRKVGDRELEFRLALDYAVRFDLLGPAVTVLLPRNPKSRVTS